MVTAVRRRRCPASYLACGPEDRLYPHSGWLAGRPAVDATAAGQRRATLVPLLPACPVQRIFDDFYRVAAGRRQATAD